MSTYRGVNVRSAQCLNSVLNVKALVGAFNQEYEPSDGPFSSSTSDAVTPRERGNERHDVLARHTDTCHTLVTCQVPWRRTLCKKLNCTANAEHWWPHSHWFVHPLTLDLYIALGRTKYSFHMVLRLAN